MVFVQPTTKHGVNATVTTPLKKDKRERFQFRWWVDATKEDQFEIGRRLELLKKSRKYTQTIMDALRLFFNLQDGKTTVLQKLFPGVVEQLRKEGEERAVQSELLRMMKEMQGRSHAPSPLTGLTQVDITDDEDVIETTEVSGDDVSSNFLESFGSFF